MTDFISKITFQDGSCREVARVTAMTRHGDDFVVMTDVTPFHPRDFQWPDQPEDWGKIGTPDGRQYAVTDAVFVGIGPDGAFVVDGDIPVKKGDPAWRFCVGHVVRGETPAIESGEEVILQVDEERRRALSRAHSASHLMALALDRSLAPLWRKEVKTDALGAPAFDELAMDVSAIGLLSCRDQYRLGKSLRKKGFSAEELRQNLKKHEGEVNVFLTAWLAQDAPISLRAEGEGLASYRFFRTRIEDKDIEMPCGGTHARSIAEIGTATVLLSMPDEETLIVETSLG